MVASCGPVLEVGCREPDRRSRARLENFGRRSRRGAICYVSWALQHRPATPDVLVNLAVHRLAVLIKWNEASHPSDNWIVTEHGITHKLAARTVQIWRQCWRQASQLCLTQSI